MKPINGWKYSIRADYYCNDGTAWIDDAELEDVSYTEQDLEDAEIQSICDSTGEVTAKLKNGSIARLASIDLEMEFVGF
jgi:hypothetical protein